MRPPRPRHTSPIDALEAQIERTRADVEDTLERLHEDLSLSQLTRNIMEMIDQRGLAWRERMVDVGQRVKTSVRDNPVPVALLGVGAMWLLWQNRRPSAMRETEAHAKPRATASPEGDVSPKVHGVANGKTEPPRAGTPESIGKVTSERYDELKVRAQKSMDDARQKAKAASEQARRKAREAGVAIRMRADDLSRSTKARFQEQPLLFGVVGILAGLLVGALLPVSGHEKRFLGPSRDRLITKTEEKVRRGMEQMGDTVEKMTSETLAEDRIRK